MKEKIILFLSKASKVFVKWFRKNSEFMALPVAIIAWYGSGYFVQRFVDPNAGVHDAGLFQTFLIATVGIFFATTTIHILLRLSFYSLDKSFDDFPEKHFDKLTPWQQAKYGLIFFFGLLVAFCCLVAIFA